MTDEELVLRWQKRRDLGALNQLRQSTKPLVMSQVNKYRSNSVPQPVLEARADQILVESVESFDPKRAASFRTHLFTNLRHLNRFSIQRANIATIPEARGQAIGTYQRAFDRLQDVKGRSPTTSELADELNWPLSQVQTMQRSLRRDMPSGHLPVSATLDTTEARRKRVLENIWYELTPDEQLVYSHLLGIHGKRKIDSGGELSRVTGFSQAKVSNLRTSIAHKIEMHL